MHKLLGGRTSDPRGIEFYLVTQSLNLSDYTDPVHVQSDQRMHSQRGRAGHVGSTRHLLQAFLSLYLINLNSDKNLTI
jgi:hypothetical protein